MALLHLIALTQQTQLYSGTSVVQISFEVKVQNIPRLIMMAEVVVKERNTKTIRHLNNCLINDVLKGKTVSSLTES